MTTRFRFGPWLVGLALFALGVVGGMRIPRTDDATPDPQATHVHSTALTHTDFERLERLGVEVTEVQLQRYVATVPVHGVIEEIPGHRLPVHAPIGGRVSQVHVAVHDPIEAGDALVTLLREPLPRPELKVTSNVLMPAQEGLHEVVRELRSRALDVELSQRELARLRALDADNATPVVSPQRIVDLEYDLERAETALDIAREEATRHGLSDERVAAILAGDHAPTIDAATWRAALVRNGLWNDAATQLEAALHEGVRGKPWTVATIGELVAGGFDVERLVQWMASDEAASRHFLDIGVLLQRGHSWTELQAMHGVGAFEDIVAVRAPSTFATYDVESVLVRDGAVLEVGDRVAEVVSRSQMMLRAEGTGRDRALLLRAFEAAAPLRATPLIEGAGPELQGVAFASIREDGALAYVDNDALSSVDSPHRTWRLRPGTRYVLHVPDRVFDEAFVVPRTALVRRGGEDSLLVRHDGHFDPHPVVVAFLDGEVAVIEPHPLVELSVGDAVVTRGALEVLGAQDAGNEDEAGHGHPH